MYRLPRRFAPSVYGLIQAAVTTGVATAIATHQVMGLSSDFLMAWFGSWGLSWLTMLPIVIAIAPLVQRAVLALVPAE